CSHPRARASRRLLGYGMGVLDEIVAHKREELERVRADTPQAELEAACRGRAPSLPFEAALRASGPGTVRLIAEVKKGSPSNGTLNAALDPVAQARPHPTPAPPPPSR